MFITTNPAYGIQHTHKKTKHSSNFLLPSNVGIEEGLTQIVSHFQGNQNVGIVIKSLENGRIIYQHNAIEKFSPASTLKLFTAAAALDFLGPQFTFSTEFLTTTVSQQATGTLSGNLYIKFGGDPYLTTDTLKKMLNTLSEQGIRSIQGNIIIDDSALDRTTWQTGRVTTDRLFCYAAPVTATIINRNCFSFNVAPSRQKNAPPAVKVNQLGSLMVDNQVVTRAGKAAGCTLDLKPFNETDNRYVLKGCLSPRKQPLAIAVALQNPNLATSAILAHLFREAGIQYHSIEFGKAPINSQVLVKNSSPTLNVLITRMLKKSDNIIADSLFKKVGGVYFSTQGSWHTGTQAQAAILGNKTGINFQNTVILDGSGLSRDNAVTPLDFVKLLTFTYNNMPNNSLFYNALPRSGIDGTLRNRLGGPTIDRVHAKTGTMQGTSGLAGYIRTANNKQVAFAILVNENTTLKKQWSYHLLEDRICQFLAKNTI
jgi:D-alanyl-D-alanine carboxypeptidase/D-alanyl-D-alanine-endopeptidase (penicillin-binding protein 4)